MGIFARLSDAVKGARKLEVFLLIALAAAVGMLMLGRGGTENGTSMEARMENVLSEIEGAGNVSVLINENDGGGVDGVLVVAEGAGDIQVKLKLLGAVKATLGIDAARIEIIEMEGP